MLEAVRYGDVRRMVEGEAKIAGVTCADFARQANVGVPQGFTPSRRLCQRVTWAIDRLLHIVGLKTA